MTEFNHSPTDMPERRAASRAASRASGRRPLRFHGPLDFILASKPHREEQGVPLSRANALNRRGGGRGSLSSNRMLRITVKKALKVGPRGHRSFIRRVGRLTTLG